jgi:creatinine amidohydrolase
VSRFRRPVQAFLALLLAAGWLACAAAPLQLDALTSTELRDAVAAGTTTVLIPIGGTEQNGAHMALGKHNYRVGLLAERVAAELGNAVVAPVLAYAPEPAGHMRHAGTITVPADAFTGLLAGAVRSLRQHGFRDIVLLGDSGDYQPLLARLSERLNREWAGSPARVHHSTAFYESVPHAGAQDTSRMLALDASRVREQAVPAGTSLQQGAASVDRTVRRTAQAIRQAAAQAR